MNICFIIHDVTARAGTERAQTALANALHARGEAVSIWSMYGSRKSSGFPLDRGVKVSFGLNRPLPFFLDYPWLICAFALFVFRRRPQWIVCTDTNRLIVALLAAFVPGVRLAVWEHFALSHSITKGRGKLARRLAAALATRIVTLTERDTELYAKLFAPAGQVTTIPNIVTPRAVAKTVRRQVILALGRLAPQKGFDLLLEAWALAAARLPGWSLRIVGDGPMRDQLERQAGRLGIEQRVSFAPFSENPFSLYAECGIFVLSSRFEGLPFVLIEAMTCGAACISFDCPNGPREVIRHGVNGLLVPAERVHALADAMVRLSENPDLRERLGEAARSVSKPFSEEQVAASWHEVLYGPALDFLQSPSARLGGRFRPTPQGAIPAALFDPAPSMAAQPAWLAAGFMPPRRGALGLYGQPDEEMGGFAGKEIKLSVLMAVHREESPACLRQCLDSLAAQTLPADEVVIVEDGPLGEPLEAAIAGYRKILPIVSLPLQSSVGLGEALRAGLYMCRGEYVARMDSGDISVPERFKKQMRFLEGHREVDVVGSAIAEFDEDCSAPRAIRLLPAAGPALRRFARSRTPMNHMTVVFRKASVVAAGNYESCQGFEDYHLWARMLTLGYRLHNMNEVLVYARGGGGMHSRRGSLACLRGEIEFQSFLRKIGLLDASGSLLNILMRGPIRLAPGSVRTLCYSLFLRSSPAAMPRPLQ
jgi:glycosyltransferase involved in cell wall biosynthesis